jgi:hypothetical protein
MEIGRIADCARLPTDIVRLILSYQVLCSADALYVLEGKSSWGVCQVDERPALLGDERAFSLRLVWCTKPGTEIPVGSTTDPAFKYQCKPIESCPFVVGPDGKSWQHWYKEEDCIFQPREDHLVWFYATPIVFLNGS